MAIMFNPLFCDVKAHGFPWIKWEEDRPFGKKVFVNCFITEGDNGELLFASNGGLLPDAVYRRRPWEKLMGFRTARAEELYYSGMEKRLRQEFMNLSPVLRLLLPNDAVVILADFDDDFRSVPMHLNYGVGTAVEFVGLHNVLRRRFIDERRAVVEKVCDGEFRLPESWDRARQQLWTEDLLNWEKRL